MQHPEERPDGNAEAVNRPPVVEQDRVPRPPQKSQIQNEGVLRHPHAVSVVDSYRQTVVRIWPSDSSQPTDLVPASGATSSVGPDALFGEGCGPAYVISGAHLFGRLATPEEDAHTVQGLRDHLSHLEYEWRPTVATSPDRQWVEPGALVLGRGERDVLGRAAYCGQSFVLRWDEAGLTPLATRPGVDVGGDEPVPVALEPALRGCPLRRGRSEAECHQEGGGWTSGSIYAAYAWALHRRLLVDAFGCELCGGRERGGAFGVTGMFTPSREGGWQYGSPTMCSLN